MLETIFSLLGDALSMISAGGNRTGRRGAGAAWAFAIIFVLAVIVAGIAYFAR